MAFGFDQTNIFAEMPLALISGDVFGIGGAGLILSIYIPSSRPYVSYFPHPRHRSHTQIHEECQQLVASVSVAHSGRVETVK